MQDNSSDDSDDNLGIMDLQKKMIKAKMSTSGTIYIRTIFMLQ